MLAKMLVKMLAYNKALTPLCLGILGLQWKNYEDTELVDMFIDAALSNKIS